MGNLLDVLIIGGGPIGLSCGLAAQQKGLKYKIVEKGSLVDSLFHYPVNMTFFSTSVKLFSQSTTMSFSLSGVFLIVFGNKESKKAIFFILKLNMDGMIP
jgi:cation diffusion facilitator CzcD-associated flavoprotein CzcO